MVLFRSFEMLVFHISIPLMGKNHSKFLSGGGLLKLLETNRVSDLPENGPVVKRVRPEANSPGEKMALLVELLRELGITLKPLSPTRASSKSSVVSPVVALLN